MSGELLQCRLKLAKAKPEELQDGRLLSQALRLACTQTSEELDQLSLLLTLFKQLKRVSSPSNAVLDVVQSLVPALQPSGEIAKLVLRNLEQPKPNQLRAGDVLTEAARFSLALPPPPSSTSSREDVLAPLFWRAAGGRTRPNLVVLNTLSPCVNWDSRVLELVKELLGGLDTSSQPALFASTIVSLLAKSNPSEIASILAPHVDSPHCRYVLPPLCTLHSAVLPLLLEHKSLPTWISLTSVGVSQGLLDLGSLPQERLRAGMGHADPAVQMKTYQLLTCPKDPMQLLQQMELIKECMLNATISSAAMRTEYTAVTHAFFSRLAQAEIIVKRNQRRGNSGDSLAALADFRTWFLRFVNGALEKCRRPPVARVLVALIGLQVYVDVLAPLEVYTQATVECLVACQGSEYAEVRSRAMALLDAATLPLAGYETLSSPSSASLLSSAYSSLSNPRRTQNEAATAALVLLFKKVVPSSSAVAFVSEVTDRLEAALDAANGGEIGLYGLIGAARALVECVDQTESWAPLFRRLEHAVQRTWEITRVVVSLASEDEDIPHEIAKAQGVLGNDVDVRSLVSGCWRATKEAAELLSTLHALPLRQHQAIWSVEDTNRAGRQFLTWLHEIRHRGTFTKIALAFGSLVEATRGLGLPSRWLEDELDYIAHHDLSTTRRSAALPYSILAIVTAAPLFDRAVERLLSLAVDPSDSTKIHAFNILKIVLLDSRNAKELDRWLERSVMVAVEAFSSPKCVSPEPAERSWNVRNVGLILFSTLVHRALSPGRAGQDAFASSETLAARQTYAAWHAKYPQILPFVARYLRERPDNGQLFPVLIILRGLRWSAEPSLAELRGLVEPLLGSREWQVRKVAAQAFASLTDPSAYFDSLAINLEPNDLNLAHGRLVLFHLLANTFIDLASLSLQQKAGLEERILASLSLRAGGGCPALAEQAMWTAVAYQWQTAPAPDYRDKVVTCARAILSNEEMWRPGGEAAKWVARFFLLLDRSSSNLSTALAMLHKSAGEASILSALNSLADWSDPLPGEVCARLVDLALDESVGDVVRGLALDELGGYWNPLNWEPGYLAAVKGWDEVLEGLVKTVKSRNVGMSEAGLPAMAWALSSALEAGQSPYETVYAQQLLLRAHPSRSQPSRYSAIRSVRHFNLFHLGVSPELRLALHQAMLALLQDDDEQVRAEAAKIIQAGRGLEEPISAAQATRLFREHIRACFSQIDEGEREQWERWLVELATEGIEEDLRALEATKDEVELFEVEKPNLWRDEEEDAAMAVGILSRHPALKGWRERVKVATGNVSPIGSAWDAVRALRRRSAVWDELA